MYIRVVVIDSSASSALGDIQQSSNSGSNSSSTSSSSIELPQPLPPLNLTTKLASAANPAKEQRLGLMSEKTDDSDSRKRTFGSDVSSSATADSDNHSTATGKQKRGEFRYICNLIDHLLINLYLYALLQSMKVSR